MSLKLIDWKKGKTLVSSKADVEKEMKKIKNKNKVIGDTIK